MTDLLEEPRDGAKTLAGAGKSYGIPMSVLAEITHRCPLQCP